jgi:hypothetical protein
MGGGDHPGQLGHQLVGVDARHLRVGLARGVDVHVATDDQPHTALGQLTVEGPQGWPGPTLGVRHALGGGGADEAIGQLETADSAWLEEHRQLLRSTTVGGERGAGR